MPTKKIARKPSFKIAIKPRPHTLSGWIRASVEDAQRIAKLNSFVLDMCTYNEVIDGKCHVCQAGAALLGRGLIKPGKHLLGSSRAAPNIALALDGIRMGVLRSDCIHLVPKSRREAWSELNRELHIAEADKLSDRARVIKAACSIIYFEACRAKKLEGVVASWNSYLTLANLLQHFGF